MPLNRLRIRIGPAASELGHNIWNLYVEIAYFGFTFGILQTFLSVFVIRLGANNTVIGLLNALPSFIFAVWSIPAARFVERTARRKRFMLVTGGLHRCGVAALGLMPFVVTQFQPEAVVVIVTLMSIPQVMANLSFAAMFADVVPIDHRAHVVAVRNTLLGLTMTLASFLGGQYLGLLPESFAAPFKLMFTFPLNYQILFVVGFAFSMVGMVYLRRIRGMEVQKANGVSARAERPTWLERFKSYARLMRSEREFSRYTIAALIIHWGLFLPVPLYSLYWVRSLHASDSFIGLILTVQSITTIVVYPLLPAMVRRIGNRGLVALSAFLVSLYPLATAFVTTLEPLLLISIIGGAGGAMFGLGSFNLLLELAPEERRPLYIGTFTSAAFSAGVVAPFVGTGLLAFIDINHDLLLGAALRFLGFLAFVLMVGGSGKGEGERV